ncbi:peptidyl-dipeptidase Dcp [Nonlabens dokdonensis]|jgi:peptidyl-dipeptidase Dcp|uniref:oligopeptidase A n=2 Tax=Nonlabens dokdonensis TaxID=328515 RepID=L7WFC7_NONDD|nr:M3 family metallopeptidase [Nonlabens dokdonensis]AGC77603.1 peptidyl-dipeptidase [Nonlabens dokdonensis DSW-6]PZX39847.1 peptidyl-dipeptidase Dcp [Nonlabens dokdonensis]
MNTNTNPLLANFETFQDTAPFSLIKEAHYESAFEKAIEEARKEINAITENSAQPNFENTIEALDASGELLGRISSIFFNLNSAETNDEIQRIAREVSPKLSEFGNDVTLNEELFARVKAVYENRATLDLTEEQKTLLEKQYKRFSRNGANLNEDKKKRLREIDSELSQLTLAFGENVLAATNAYELHLEDDSRLSGLPESAKEAAAETAKAKNKEGYVFTLDYPSYIPFMTYADDRELREELSKAFGAKAYKDDYDNQENVLKIAQLRYERAQLLGYETHAHFVLEERMAKTPETVNNFSQEILEKAKPAAQREFDELQEFARNYADNPVESLKKWDAAYYSEKLKQKLYSLDDELLKPYFKLENVINGVFEIASRLYGLSFEETQEIQKYHPDVLTYVVKNEDNSLNSIFYADFFPRKGKRNGAWMTSFKNQWHDNGHNIRPHVSNVCNFTKPTATKPSLLTFNEVTTLFHEFGHALHGMLADTKYRSLSGTSVFWDFVELPSQVLENWCYEKEALEIFARHYETDEVIPLEYIEKIKAAANFQEGLQTLRQLSFGMMDMSWHGIDPTAITDVKAHERKTFDQTDLYPDVESSCMSTSFAHIFQGGYSAGYYSYKWAEVLDADAFELFQENGIFDRPTAKKFRDNVLSRGGTEDPMLLYTRFRGSEPKIDALLKRAGLVA